MSFSSIHFGVVQRTKRYTALARFAYQTCGAATDCFGSVDYRHHAAHHVGGCVLLPTGAPAKFAVWENFLAAAAYRETRRDAQDGRILDFALPRAVPREMLLPLSAFALLPFIELGMAVRLDVECVEASDGERNPHAHSWLSQRVLEQGGFGLKERLWNTLFWRDSGRYVRSLVAARLTLGCAILGIEAFVDPRRNEERGAGIPEPRLSRQMCRMYNEGRHVEQFEELKASRELRRNCEAAEHAPAPEVAGVTVTNAAVYHVDDAEADTLRKWFGDAAQEAGYDLANEPDALSGLPAVSLIGTAVAFDGRAFTIAEAGGSEDAAIVARFVRELDWPALVVEGGGRLADRMAIAAAYEGVFIINRAPSAGARDLISRAFYGELKAPIARHDPLGVAAEFLVEFEAKRAFQQVSLPVEEAFMYVAEARENKVQYAANLAPPTKAPVLPGKAAVLASGIAPILSEPVSERRGMATRLHVRQSADSSSEVLENLPDGDSRKKKPDPAELARNARLVQAYDDRMRQQDEDLNAMLRRLRDRSSGLRDDESQLPRPP